MLDGSFIEQIEARRKESEENKERAKALEAEYKIALNSCFSSAAGRIVLKRLVKFSGIFSLAHSDHLLEDRGRKSVYLQAIRPYLDKEIINQVENGD